MAGVNGNQEDAGFLGRGSQEGVVQFGSPKSSDFEPISLGIGPVQPMLVLSGGRIARVWDDSWRISTASGDPTDYSKPNRAGSAGPNFLV